MIGVLDLFAVSVLDNKFKELVQHPDRIEYMLCGFHINQNMFDFVGAEYIKNSIEFLLNNKVTIIPYYNLDAMKNPTIAVISSGGESQQFIGDYGFQADAQQTVKNSPLIIAEFTATTISGKDMTVAPELKLNEKLWPGVVITNGEFSNTVEGIMDASTICFRDEFPENISPENWTAQTSGTDRRYVINASTDSVSVQCKLTTHGDPSLHRLMSVILRGIIKSARLDFESIGFQNTKVSYGSMVLTNQDDLTFESVVTIDGIFTDHWILREYDTIDASSNIGIDMTVTSEYEYNEDVEIDV